MAQRTKWQLIFRGQKLCIEKGLSGPKAGNYRASILGYGSKTFLSKTSMDKWLYKDRGGK